MLSNAREEAVVTIGTGGSVRGFMSVYQVFTCNSYIQKYIIIMFYRNKE